MVCWFLALSLNARKSYSAYSWNFVFSNQNCWIYLLKLMYKCIVALLKVLWLFPHFVHATLKKVKSAKHHTLKKTCPLGHTSDIVYLDCASSRFLSRLCPECAPSVPQVCPSCAPGNSILCHRCYTPSVPQVCLARLQNYHIIYQH